jgi:hypothetical protein
MDRINTCLQKDPKNFNIFHFSDWFMFVRFQVLTAASMMFRVVFWVILPCKMIVDRRFRGAYILHGSISQKTTLNIVYVSLIFKVTQRKWESTYTKTNRSTYRNSEVRVLKPHSLQQHICISVLKGPCLLVLCQRQPSLFIQPVWSFTTFKRFYLSHDCNYFMCKDQYVQCFTTGCSTFVPTRLLWAGII